ncbi:branched-chain amino acid ABC transporter permease [Nitrosopumilus ureiphilus]|uniref:Branched-chain amino acid ABC transporter permease n=1 Tax=Nitrosopumilus ureiphilus TaxID=1470067 RepID=A0A7D5RGB2_9ARCH|nr:branched-chain amino acid ABC transporter permease [Nitrosopumilus ureiphilus]QLH06605.1 branched-chain amino acid ABC transporter permease [Nitrosopumilus ureiphilus]
MVLEAETIFIVDLLAIFAIYVIVNLSLNMEFGYTGIPNFGKVLAVGAGAFVAASIPGRIFASIAGIEGDYITDNLLIVSQINLWLVDNVGIGFVVFFLTLGIAAGVGGGIGLLTSYPAIRLRGDYLAITLLAFGESIRIIGNNYTPLVGGTLGVQVPDPLSFLPNELRFPIATIGLVAIAAVIYVYSERMIRSPLGRMLRAVRDNEVAAEALGKNSMQIRIKVIMISAALAAIGGALYAFYVGGTIAFAYDRASWTFWPFLMILIGGLANNKGVLIGTLVFVTLRKFIIFFKDSLEGFVPFDVIWLDFLLLGAILLAILLYRPQGIFVEKPTPTLANKTDEEQSKMRKIFNLFFK